MDTDISIIGTDLQKDMDVAISQKARRQGLYIIGANGTGKTTLLANLIAQDIEQGLGVCLIEPHGDLTKAVVSLIPENRIQDVVLLGLEDAEYPWGMNLFQCENPDNLIEVAKTANFVMHVFEKVWDVGTHTPQLAQVLRNVTRTLIENPGTTFAEIPLLLWEDTFREELTSNLKNKQTQMFWNQYSSKSWRDRNEYISSTMNKVDAYLNEPMIANIVSQARTTINFRRIMDEGKILLVNLSPQLEEMSRLIGAILIGKILMAAFSRADTPEDERRQFPLYCDEYQRFATADFATLISEARKFSIATTLSHQVLSQLDDQNRSAAQAAANIIVFRVSGQDGKHLAKSFDNTPTKEVVGEEPIRAPVSDVIGHLIKRGHNETRVTGFAQTYLRKLEDFISKNYSYYLVHDRFLLYPVQLLNKDIRKGRELLNETLYSCMVKRTSNLVIPPLAVYMLAVAQEDEREEVFYTYIEYSGFPLNEPGFDFRGFKKKAEIFGEPSFIESDFAAKFRKRKLKEAASAVVKMVKELRYAMAILAKQPITVDTGQYQPKYQQRTYSDMEAQIARDLSQQPNFQAKVKLLAGEHVIQTFASKSGLSGDELAARIYEIKRRMRSPEFGYCRYFRDVEQEVRERQERLLSEGADEPPPSYY